MSYATLSSQNRDKHGRPARMCKRLFNNGKPDCETYGFAYTSQLSPVEVNSLGDLFSLVAFLQDRPHDCLLRGHPIENTSAWQRRTINEPATIARDSAPRWLMIDVDDLTLAECGLGGVLRDYSGRQLADAAQQHLPACFHNASYIAQFSNSHNFGSDQKIKLHLFFWTDREYTADELSLVARHENWREQHVDTATLSSVNQVHYVARPELDGIVDPWPLRIGLVSKPQKCVQLSIPSPEVKTEIVPKNTIATATDLERICRFDAYASKMPTAVRGDGRSRTFFRFLCELVRFDIPEHQALAIAQQFNLASCSPPYSPQDVKRQYENACNRARNERGCRLQDGA